MLRRVAHRGRTQHLAQPRRNQPTHPPRPGSIEKAGPCLYTRARYRPLPRRGLYRALAGLRWAPVRRSASPELYDYPPRPGSPPARVPGVPLSENASGTRGVTGPASPGHILARSSLPSATFAAPLDSEARAVVKASLRTLRTVTGDTSVVGQRSRAWPPPSEWGRVFDHYGKWWR